MSELICNAPFCKTHRNKNHAWCPIHRWEREKYKVKPYKEVLPLWAGRRCNTHGLIRISDTSFRKTVGATCKLCNQSKYCPDKQKKYIKKYTRRQANWRLNKRYGITIEEYESLLENQNFQCGVCKISLEDYKNAKNIKSERLTTRTVKFSVDHCHDSGRVRGLLCHKCNMGLGYFNDNPELTQAATNYLIKN